MVPGRELTSQPLTSDVWRHHAAAPHAPIGRDPSSWERNDAREALFVGSDAQTGLKRARVEVRLVGAIVGARKLPKVEHANID